MSYETFEHRFVHDKDMELIRIHLTVISDYICDLGHFKNSLKDPKRIDSCWSSSSSIVLFSSGFNVFRVLMDYFKAEYIILYSSYSTKGPDLSASIEFTKRCQGYSIRIQYYHDCWWSKRCTIYYYELFMQHNLHMCTILKWPTNRIDNNPYFSSSNLFYSDFHQVLMKLKSDVIPPWA